MLVDGAILIGNSLQKIRWNREKRFDTRTARVRVQNNEQTKVREDWTRTLVPGVRVRTPVAVASFVPSGNAFEHLRARRSRGRCTPAAASAVQPAAERARAVAVLVGAVVFVTAVHEHGRDA